MRLISIVHYGIYSVSGFVSWLRQGGWAPRPEAQATALVASRGRRWEACGWAPPSSVVMGGLRPLKAPGSTG